MSEPKIMDGNITVPYSWTTGPAAGAFLMALRDDKKILGVKCSGCGEVMCPPRDVCPRCFVLNDEYVEVGPSGTVEAFTVMHVQNDHQPAEPPYVMAVIKLENADTGLIHILGDVEADKVERGMKVEPSWKEDRQGLLTDIEYFKPA